MIDVALATRNRGTFARVLEELDGQTVASKLHLAVMDGNDDDRVRRHVESRPWRFASIRLTTDASLPAPEEGRVHGWPRIYNHLLSMGNAPFLTYWSDDLELLTSDAFERAVAGFQTGGVGAVTFVYADDVHPGFRVSRREFGNAIHFGLIRRRVFEAVGGLHETYRFWYADDDLSCRILRAGYSIESRPDIRVVNHRSGWVNPDRDHPDDRLLFLHRLRTDFREARLPEP